MNALFETLDEMTIGVRLANAFAASKSHFDPRKMLIAIGFHLNGDGLRRLNSLSKVTDLSEPFDSDEFEIIDLEKDYFIVPEYVLENDSQYQELLNKWSETRSEADLKAFLEFTEINHDKTKQAWRSKSIGSRTDLAIFEKDDLGTSDRYHVLAIASESLPYQWLEAFLRDVGNGNSVAWYGHNDYSSDHGIMTILDDKIMIGKTDTVGSVLRSVMNVTTPEDDHKLTVIERYRMEADLDELITLIRKRPSLSQNDAGERPVDLWIAEIGKLDVDTGADYWRLADLNDRILNSLNTQSQFNHLIRTSMVFKDKITRVNKAAFEKAYQDAITERGQLLKDRGEEFTPSSKDYSTWRFSVLHGAGGVEALDNVLDKRDEEIEFAKTMNAVAEKGFTEEKLKDMADKALDQVLSKHGKSVKAYQDNQEAKAKWSDQEELDNIIECERTMAQAYIDEAKDVALNTSVKMVSPEDVINFLIKVYQEKGLAQRVHSDLVASDATDTDLKDLYFEILDFCLSKRLQYQFTQAEIGSFYNWLEKVNGEKLTGSKTAKARKLIDDLVKREEAELRGYIEDVEMLAKSNGIEMDYAGALLLLEKLFGEYAKETLEQLAERDSEDEDWQTSYLEVASISLKPVNQHKVTREELGAFYLWLNATRRELNKGK